MEADDALGVLGSGQSDEDVAAVDVADNDGNVPIKRVAGGVHQAGGLRRDSEDDENVGAGVLQTLGLGGDVGLDDVVLLNVDDLDAAALDALAHAFVAVLAQLVALLEDAELAVGVGLQLCTGQGICLL